MSSREQILKKLRQLEKQRKPFPAVTPPDQHLPMVPRREPSPAGLLDQFITAAQKADCTIHQVPSPQAAIAVILDLIGVDAAISSWDPAQIPLPGLAEALEQANITWVGQDAQARVGLSGVDAALAATGSLVVLSGPGRYRAASLLAPIHIAVVTRDQIVPDLESWWEYQKQAGLEHMRTHSNLVVITGPSRTADIAMQLVMGMHGPRELHLVLVDD